MPFVKGNKLYQLARRHRTYYKYGTEPDATIAGSFGRIDEGVARGFSYTNFLKISDSFDVSGGKTWEMVYKITTGADVNTTQSICGHDGSTNNDPVVISVKNSKFIIDLAYSSSTTYYTVAGSYTVLADTTYYVKLTFDGSVYTFSYSLNGIDFVEDIKLTNSSSIWTSNLMLGGQESQGERYHFLGSIDLNESYININGTRWWSGDSYTTVGSWIDEGVVSGFSTSNYLTLPETFNVSDGSTWEMVYKFTAKNVGTYQFICGVDFNGAALSINGFNYTITKKLGFFLSHTAGKWDIGGYDGITTIEEGKTYWVKVLFNGSEYQVLLADNADFNNATTEITINSTATISPLNNMYVGGLRNANIPLQSSIDLNESYIKINDKMWWHGTKAVELNVGGGDVYEDWEQPVLTSNTDKNCIVTCSAAYSGYPAYYAMDNSTTNCWFPNATTGWWQIKLPKKILITGLTHIAGAYSQQTQGITGRYYTSSGKTTPIGDEISGIYEQGTAVNISNIPAEGILTDTIYFEKTGGSVTHENSGIGQLLITAKELKAVGGSVEDADYYVDTDKLYRLIKNKRTYYKYIPQDWTQPVLTANGELGGDSFACTQSHLYSSEYAYKVFDGSTSTQYSNNGNTGSLTFYNPEPLKVTNIHITNGNIRDYVRPISSGVISGSNNNTTWTPIKEFTNSVTALLGEWDIDLSDNNTAYNYYKIDMVGDGSYASITEIDITAQELKSYEINLYGEDIWEDWEQPVLTDNGSIGDTKFAVSASSTYNDNYAYKAFNQTGASDYWHSGQGFPSWVQFYNPNPLEVSELIITNRAVDGSMINSYGISYSDDGVTFTEFTTGTSPNQVLGGSFTVDTSGNGSHKYWRITSYSTSGNNNGYTAIGEISITAKELKAVGGTIEDADYYVDKYKFY